MCCVCVRSSLTTAACVHDGLNYILLTKGPHLRWLAVLKSHLSQKSVRTNPFARKLNKLFSCLWLLPLCCIGTCCMCVVIKLLAVDCSVCVWHLPVHFRAAATLGYYCTLNDAYASHRFIGSRFWHTHTGRSDLDSIPVGSPSSTIRFQFNLLCVHLICVCVCECELA